jgi:hypothetical protein
MEDHIKTARELLSYDEKLTAEDRLALLEDLKYVLSDPTNTLAAAKRKLIEIKCFRQLDLAPFDLLFWPHPLVMHHSAPGRSEALRRP